MCSEYKDYHSDITVGFNLYSRNLSIEELAVATGIEPNRVWAAGTRRPDSALANFISIAYEVRLERATADEISAAIDELLKRLAPARETLLSVIETLSTEVGHTPPRLWISGRPSASENFAQVVTVGAVRELAALGCEIDIELYD